VGPAPQEGVVVPLGGGGSYMYEGHICFERSTGVTYNICSGRHFAWLTYFTYYLVSVLAANYKQHIMLPAKLRKVCYSFPELYVKSVYFNSFGWRGA
jgi:hypothetical protein